VSRKTKLRERIVSGEPKNIDFTELCTFLQQTGFSMRQGGGSHHTFHKLEVQEIIDLQPKSDGKAKPYQVRQVRDIVERYQL
jgi:predicted RNA binding protein YcfA (HicA-like mRNA interferase family)